MVPEFVWLVLKVHNLTSPWSFRFCSCLERYAMRKVSRSYQKEDEGFAIDFVLSKNTYSICF